MGPTIYVVGVNMLYLIVIYANYAAYFMFMTSLAFENVDEVIGPLNSIYDLPSN